MLPHVIIHNSVSADGRVDAFEPDIGLHYETASRWKIDVHLVGSNTLLAMESAAPDGTDGGTEPEHADTAPADDSRPLLVVPDSRGRLRKLHLLRKQPYWRDILVLGSRATPARHLDDLRAHRIETFISGEERVDPRASLEMLKEKRGASVVLVDSGGTLNGVLLRAGLVDEVSLLVSPCLVGGAGQKSFFRAADLDAPGGVVQLELQSFEKMRGDVLWLRYAVRR